MHDGRRPNSGGQPVDWLTRRCVSSHDTNTGSDSFVRAKNLAVDRNDRTLFAVVDGPDAGVRQALI